MGKHDWREVREGIKGRAVIGGSICILHNEVGVNTLRGKHGLDLEGLMLRVVYKQEVPGLYARFFELYRRKNFVMGGNAADPDPAIWRQRFIPDGVLDLTIRAYIC